MELSKTSYVILGMLRTRPHSGYDIKQLVDRSTRFFWAASYGQIYPELRRLAEAELIEGSDDSQGARKRNSYRLTETGQAAHRKWLAAPPEVMEARDETLLKLFFSDFAGLEGRVAALEAKRDYHTDVAARLRAIGAGKPEGSGGPEGEDSGLLTLRFGIAFNDFVAAWCEHEAERARAGAPDAAEGRT